MTEANYYLALGIGILSFFSPCILPVLPGYFSYLSGIKVNDDQQNYRRKLFLTSFSFVVGFSFILIILGTTASLASQILIRNKWLWQKIGGTLIILFGLQATGLLKINPLKREINFHLEKYSSWQFLKSFLAGSSFGISWTPCIGPILGSILILSSQTRTMMKGIVFLAFYCLGLSIPMIAAGQILSKTDWHKLRYLPLFSGGLLILLGTLLFFNQYSKLTIWTAQVFRTLKIPVF